MVAQRRRLRQSGRTTALYAGICFKTYYRLERGLLNPLNISGVWRGPVINLCTYWGCDPEDVFPTAGVIRSDAQPGSAELSLSQFTMSCSRNDIDTELDQGVRLRWIAEHIEQLSPIRKEVLVKHVFDMLSLEEIAKQRGTTGQACASAFIDAMNKLILDAGSLRSTRRYSVKGFFR